MIRRQVVPGVIDPKALIAQAMEFIEAHPERWNQETWGETEPGASLTEPCGTTGCLAGWMAWIDGMEPGRVGHLVEGLHGQTWTFIHEPGKEGSSTDIETWAAQRLDLEDGEDLLFGSDNSMAVLRAGVDAYLKDRDVRLAVLNAKRDEEEDDE